MRKKALLILTLMLLVGALGARAAEAYCYFKPSDGSLNFCYNDSRQSWINQGYSTYNLNTGSNSPSWSNIASQVTEIKFWSTFSNYRPTTCYRWAYGMNNLTKVTNISYLNTSSVTNMAYMFHICNKLTSLDVSGFNTSNVTDMQSMFRGCSSLKTLDVSNFKIHVLSV